MTEKTSYYLRYLNKFLVKGDKFTAVFTTDEAAIAFETEDAAVAKAKALKLDLERINVIRIRSREEEAPES